ILDATLEHRSDPGGCNYPSAPIRAQAYLWPYALGPHSLLGKGTVHRSEDNQCHVGNRSREARISRRNEVAPLPDPGGWVLRVEETKLQREATIQHWNGRRFTVRLCGPVGTMARSGQQND